MLEVIVEDTEAENHLAWIREVMVKPQGYGGDTAGFNIPFTVSEDGESKQGYVSAESMKTGNPTFTAGALPIMMRAKTPVATTAADSEAASASAKAGK